MEVQDTRTSEARPKRKEKTKHVKNLKNTLRTFFENFWIAPKGPPSIFSCFATSWSFTRFNGSPFYIFRHCDNVQKSHFHFFWKFHKVPKGSHFNFFLICNQLEFHKAQRVPPFTTLSLRYSANFGRSRLVFVFHERIF